MRNACQKRQVSCIIVDMEIELKGVTKKYDLDTLGIEDVTLKMNGVYGIAGEAGAGLHTLLGVIGGVLDADSGELLFGGRRMNGIDPKKRNAYLSERGRPPLGGSVERNLTYGLRIRGCGGREAAEIARGAACAVGAEKLLGKNARALSPSDAFAAELARMIARRPDVAMFYDPFCAFGDKERAASAELMLRAAEIAGCTAVAATPCGSDLAYFPDGAAVMRGGRIIRDGKTADVFADPGTAYVACFVSGVPMNIIRDGGAIYAVSADDARLTEGDLPVAASGCGYTAILTRDGMPPFTVRGETSDLVAGFEILRRTELTEEERTDRETAAGGQKDENI